MADQQSNPISAIEQVYNQLAEVFGGTNTSQIFSMLMPGSQLNIDDFRYNTNQLKPTLIKEAESRLVNQMFDIAKVQAGSNGQKVSSQYMQALSVLVPKFNPLLPEVKTVLRNYINLPAPEVIVDGQPFKGTFQEYYFLVYEKWLEAKSQWQKDCEDKKNELEQKLGKKEAAEKYAAWFEIYGEVKLAQLDALYGKILSVFSPSDMNVILGALTSGPSSEIEEALNFVNAFRAMSSSGNYVYPVDLTPSNWSQFLMSNIHPVDLLKDPEFILISLKTKKDALKSCLAQLANLASKAPSNQELAKAKAEYDKLSKEYDEALNALQNVYTDNTLAAVEMYLKRHPDKTSDFSDTDKTEVDKEAQKASEAKREAGASKEIAKKKGDTESSTFSKEDIKKIADGLKTINEKQTALVQTGKKLADNARNITSIEASVINDISFFVSRFQAMVDDVNEEEQKLILSINNPKKPIDIESGAEKVSVSPNAGKSDPFMTFQFSFTQASMDSEFSAHSEASESKTKVNFFFGGYENSSSSSSASVSNKSFAENTNIKIAFKAAKVDIDREWMNPGVFKITTGMNRLASEVISKGAMKVKDGALDWNAATDMNKAIFPSFPTAFVIAKDITIEFSADSQQISSVHEVMDKKSSSGGGIFCFSASSAAASRDEHSALHAHSQGTNFRISMPAPQILGWYLQLTPEDKSTVLDLGPQSMTAKGEDLNIIQFVNAMREMASSK